MKLAVVAFALCAPAGCVAGSPSHVHFGGMDRFERAGVVAADSGCDNASARETSDPASHCFVSRSSKE